jgi:hypothetical protein
MAASAVGPPEPPNPNHKDDPRGSQATLRAVRIGPTTILFGVYPLVFCAGCGARWTQTGSEQRAIKQLQEPARSTSARYPLA